MFRRLLLALTLILALAVPAVAQDYFWNQVQTCTDITAPVVNKTWCMQQSNGGLYLYVGPNPALMTSWLRQDTSGPLYGPIPSYTYADLPTPGTAGRLARVTDTHRGVYVDTGIQWIPFDGRFLPEWWGAYSDGTHAAATTAAINAASAATASYVGPIADLGDIGGACVHLGSGVYAVNASIQAAMHNVQTLEYCLEGEGQYNTYIAWTGGNNSDIVQVHRPDFGNIIRLTLRHLTVFNQQTGPGGGAGVLRLRATGVNGIRLNDAAFPGGIEHALISDVRCWYVDNCIVSTGTINNLRVENSMGDSVYNQTNPPVNPLTDALVDGHGTFLYFDATSAPISVQMVNNRWYGQGYMLDAFGATGVVSLTYDSNYINSDSSFIRRGHVRLSAFNAVSIVHNLCQPTGSGTHGIFFDLGTTAMGAGGLSGGELIGNNCSGDDAANPLIRLNFADGITIMGGTLWGISPAQIGIVTIGNTSRLHLGKINWVGITRTFETTGGTTYISEDDISGTVGTLFDPEGYVQFYEEFHNNPNAALTPGTIVIISNPWTLSATGVYTQLGGGVLSGGLRIEGDGAAAGSVSATGSAFVNTHNPVLKVRWAQQGAGAGLRFIGLASSSMTANPNNGIYFRNAAGGNIIAVCRSGGVESVLDTLVAAADTVYHSGRIVITGTNTAAVYVDKVWRGMITTNVPGVDLLLSAGSDIVAAASGINVDYMYVSQSR